MTRSRWNEILSERTRAHQRGEIGVGGRRDPDVSDEAARRAERPVLAVLQQPQQLDLRRGAERVDLVEEERAPLGFGDQAALGSRGVGEGSPGVAEQLVLEQVIWDGAAVQGDERAIAPLAQVVNRPRHQFLARSRLAGEQHRGARSGRASDLAEHQDEPRIATDERRLLLPAGALGLRRGYRQQTAESQLQVALGPGTH